MPILDVEIVTRPGEILPAALAADLAEATGGVFNSPPGTTWVKVRALHSEQYAENGVAPAESVYPIFVAVLRARLPSGETLKEEAARLAEVIARICLRPRENIHIFYQPAGAGRIAFGGNLLSDE